MNTFAVSFVVRASKANKEGLSPIELSISIDGERSYINLPRKINHSKFDSKKQAVKGKGDDVKDVNEYLQLMKNKVYEAQTKLIKLDLAVTTQNIKDMFMDKIKGKQYTLIALYEEYAADMQKKIGKTIVAGTHGKHLLTIKQLKEFIKQDYNRDDINLSELNGIFVDNFFNFLLATLHNNTACGSMKRFKSVVRMAINNKFTDNNPFGNFKMKVSKTSVPYLTEKELKSIISKDFSCDRLNKIRDVFVFNSLTGLSFSDCKAFKKEDNIIIDENGNKWIYQNRIKTDNLCRIPLLPLAEFLLEKYDYQLPVPSNTKMNAYLKEIQDLCGITKTLTTHVARHTAATLFLNNGTSLDSVAAILGHSSTKMTERYAKLLDVTIMKQADNMKLKFAV